MGNEAEFHLGKRHSREGIEFVGGRKKTSFRQKVARIDETTNAAAMREALKPVVAIHSPEAVLPVTMPTADPLDHIYQEPLLSAPTESEELDDLAFHATSRPEPIIELHETTPLRPGLFRRLVSYFIALVALAVLALSIFFMMHNTPNIPSDIRKKADFTVYDMAANPLFKFDKGSVQLASQNNLVYYVDNVKNKAHFVVSQQKIPDLVKNDADYQQFLTDFDKYAEFSSGIGKAYFTHPSNIGSDVSVVVKTTTTLLFIRGPGTTSETDWSRLLGLLKVVK